MIKASNNRKKFSIPIKLIGPNKKIEIDFFIDTGFTEWIKIDKGYFDLLGIEKIKENKISMGNGIPEKGDIGIVNFETDNLSGNVEVLAIGWGGRNVIGIKFLSLMKALLVFDFVDDGGIYLTNNRNVAFDIGRLLYEYHN